MNWWCGLVAAVAVVGGALIGAVVERHLFRRKHGRAILALGHMIQGPDGTVTHSARAPKGRGRPDLLNLVPPGDRSALMELWRDAH